MKRILISLALLLGAVALARPAAAQATSPQLTARANDLVRLLRDEAQPAELFSDAFLAAVPAAQVTQISSQLRAQYGAVRGLNRVEPQSPLTAVVYVDFERSRLRFNLAVDEQPPHRIAGLLLVGADVEGDSFAALAEEIRALPGASSFAVARLGGPEPDYVAEHDAQRPLAIGSAFKLFILAELDRTVRAGERRWSDVVAIDRYSPSGPMEHWPQGAPVTLHTLATLMISQSDNSATDILLHVLGRENVERIMPVVGVAAPERNRPFLSTLEAFALKSAADPVLQSWLSGDEATRRALLASRFASLSPADLDGSRFTGAPNQIETIEWFASAQDLVRTMDWLRQNGSEETRAILAVNPGISRPTAGELGYVGYKGGSEPGVINMTFLVRDRAGAWHAIAGSWNNPEAPVDQARFAGLMARAVQLLR